MRSIPAIALIVARIRTNWRNTKCGQSALGVTWGNGAGLSTNPPNHLFF